MTIKKLISKSLDIIIFPILMIPTTAAFIMLIMMYIFKPIIFVLKITYKFIARKISNRIHHNDYKDYYDN